MAKVVVNYLDWLRKECKELDTFKGLVKMRMHA